MAGTPVAVQGCMVSITSGQTATSIQITTQPSQKNKVGGKGIYFGNVDVTLTAVTVGSLVCASATLTISGSAQTIFDKTSGDKAVLKGDSASDTFTFTDSSTGSTTDLTISVKITDAGQTAVSEL